MKRIQLPIAFLLLSIACVENVQAVDCAPADIQLSSQSEVDNFQANHGPDCDTVTGDLLVGSDEPGNGGTDISNLDGLTQLQVIQGRLVIQGNPLLAGIAGLVNLVSVGGNLEILNNELLADCQALNVLLDGYYDGDLEPVFPAPDLGGEILMGGNATGCNSREDIAPLPIWAYTMTGSWYSRTEPGAGFMWHAVNDELAVAYYYGFIDTGEFGEAGDRFWLIGIHEGPIERGELITFEFNYVTGGRFQNFQPENISQHHFGTMELFPGCQTSALTISGVFPGTDTPKSYIRHLERLAPVAGYECYRTNVPADPTDGLTGSWFDSNTPGQGFSVHKVDDDTGIVYFYGFDRAGEPLWLFGVWDEAVSFGQEMTVEMLVVSGGRFFFPFPSDPIVESEWGILRIRFDGCTSGWAELSGDDGAQEFELDLLAGSAGLECAVSNGPAYIPDES